MQHTTPIYNIIPGDFTLDGKLDILVMSVNSATTLNMALYKGNHDGTFGMSCLTFSARVSRCLTESTPISSPSSALPQPMPVDLDGDMKIDLLGMIPSSQGSSTPLKAWRNTWNVSESQPTLFNLSVLGLVTSYRADWFPAWIHPSMVHSASWPLHTAMPSSI